RKRARQATGKPGRRTAFSWIDLLDSVWRTNDSVRCFLSGGKSRLCRRNEQTLFESTGPVPSRGRGFVDGPTYVLQAFRHPAGVRPEGEDADADGEAVSQHRAGQVNALLPVDSV